MTKNQSTIAKKNIAQDFLKLTEAGKAQEAFKLYVAKSFKHHNARFKGDRDSLIAAMENTASRFPQLVSKRHAVLEDGDLVAVHSHIKPLPNTSKTDLTYMHIFRFNKGNKITELWDFGQAVPVRTINENGLF